MKDRRNSAMGLRGVGGRWGHDMGVQKKLLIPANPRGAWLVGFKASEQLGLSWFRNSKKGRERKSTTAGKLRST